MKRISHATNIVEYPEFEALVGGARLAAKALWA